MRLNFPFMVSREPAGRSNHDDIIMRSLLTIMVVFVAGPLWAMGEVAVLSVTPELVDVSRRPEPVLITIEAAVGQPAECLVYRPDDWHGKKESVFRTDKILPREGAPHLYTATVVIPPHTPAAEYTVACFVSDRVTAVATQTLMVNSDKQDFKPPQLRSIRFEPPEVKPGGTTQILVEVADDASGLESLSLLMNNATIVDKKKRKKKPELDSMALEMDRASCKPVSQESEVKHLCAMELLLPKTAQLGPWQVVSCQIIDQYGRTSDNQIQPGKDYTLGVVKHPKKR